MIGPEIFSKGLDICSVSLDRENYSLSNSVLGFFKKWQGMIKTAIKDEIVVASL